MDQNLHLLAEPDIRPVQDAREWFKDGFHLICRFPGLWAGYSGIGLVVVFVLLTLMQSNIPLLPLPLIMLFSAYWFVVLQSGAFRLMHTISSGEQPRLGEMFWLFGQMTRGSLWQYLLFLVVFNMSLEMLRRLIYAESFSFNGTFHSVNLPLLIAVIGFNIIATLVTLAINWAILPILSQFPATDFTTAFGLQISGTVGNWRSLGLFMLLVSAFYFLLSFLVSVCFMLYPPLALALVVALLLWLWPMTFAWSFSAARHIFMRW